MYGEFVCGYWGLIKGLLLLGTLWINSIVAGYKKTPLRTSTLMAEHAFTFIPKSNEIFGQTDHIVI